MVSSAGCASSQIGGDPLPPTSSSQTETTADELTIPGGIDFPPETIPPDEPLMGVLPETSIPDEPLMGDLVPDATGE